MNVNASLTVNIGEDVWLETYGSALNERDNPTNFKKGLPFLTS